MAVRPAIFMPGLRALQRDLRKMSVEASVEVRAVVKAELEPMVQHARSRAPGTGKTIGSRFRATMRGASGAITNSHPGARPHEFGGTIAPKGTPISLAPAKEMIYGRQGALEQRKGEVERGLIAGFERLARSNGWN